MLEICCLHWGNGQPRNSIYLIKKYPKLGIFIYGLLLISCLIEISVELGIHEFDDFASHHGLAIFAFGSLFANWDELTRALKYNKKNKDVSKDPL